MSLLKTNKTNLQSKIFTVREFRCNYSEETTGVAKGLISGNFVQVKSPQLQIKTVP